MDICDRYLTQRAANAMADAVRIFMDCYGALAREPMSKGLSGWHLVQKFHYLCHLESDIRMFRTNPRFHNCFCMR